MFRARWNKPRKPKRQVPVVNAVGWWSYQNSMIVESFVVECIESRLNLLNTNSLMAYTISGSLKYQAGHEPFVKNIHVAEEVVQNVSIENGLSPKAILKLTPVIAVKENKNYKGDSIRFKIYNEHTIQSMGWGLNILQFECGAFKKEMILQQAK